jgi:hypothetical protein
MTEIQTSGLGPGCGATASIHITLWNQRSCDLANVSVNDDFRLVIWLFGFVFLGGGLVYVPCMISIFIQFKRLKSLLPRL